MSSKATKNTEEAREKKDQNSKKKRVRVLFSKRRTELSEAGSRQIDTASHLYDDRLSYASLEVIYFDHPLATRGTNILIQETLAAGFEIKSEDKKAEDAINEWINSLQEPFEDYIEEILQNMVVGGNSYVEKVKNVNESQLAGISIVDPNSIDLQRDTDGIVERDEKTKIPQGWVQVGDDSIKNVKFKYNDIAHFKLYKLSNSIIALGVLEPAYSTFKSLRKMEDGYAEAEYRHGYPNWDIVVGDENGQATADDKKEADKLADDIVAGQDVFVHDTRKKVTKQESKTHKSATERFSYFIDIVCATFGVPRGDLLGTGEGSNRATARELSTTKEKHIRALQKNIARTFEDKIFKDVLKLNYSITNSKVSFKWNELRPEDQTSKMERLTKLAKVGLLTPDPELEKWVREQEGLPEKKIDTSKVDSDSHLPQQTMANKGLSRKESAEDMSIYLEVEYILQEYNRSLQKTYTNFRRKLISGFVPNLTDFKKIVVKESKALLDKVGEDIEKYVVLAYRKGQKVAIDEGKIGKTHELATDRQVINHLVELNEGYIVDLTSSITTQIERAVENGLVAEESINQIQSRIDDIFTKDLKIPRKGYTRTNKDGSKTEVKPGFMTIPLYKRLEMIATEETRESFRQARINHYNVRRPDVENLTWVSLFRNTCQDCEELDGKTFAKGNVPDRPHVNCQCTVVPAIAAETVSDPSKVTLPITGKPTFARSKS